MLHAQLVIHRLHADGGEHFVRYGTLMVAARAESAQLDWEVVAQLPTDTPTERRVYNLALTVVAGADESGQVELMDVSGPAILVRSVQGTCVFRGDGTLAGFDLAGLRG